MATSEQQAQQRAKIVSAAVKLAGVSAIAALAYLVPTQEGTALKAYRDPIGIPTICDGRTEGVRMGDVATPEQCAAWLQPRLREEVAYVRSVTKGPMPDTRAAALGDFTFNVGRAAYARSSILRKLNAGDITGGCNALTLYVYAGGQVLPGLVQRRQIEKDLCLYEPPKTANH